MTETFATECPECEATDGLTYIEDASIYRRVISVDSENVIIDSHYDVADEGSDNPRFLCGCGHEWPVDVSDLAIDFV